MTAPTNSSLGTGSCSLTGLKSRAGIAADRPDRRCNGETGGLSPSSTAAIGARASNERDWSRQNHALRRSTYVVVGHVAVVPVKVPSRIHFDQGGQVTPARLLEQTLVEVEIEAGTVAVVTAALATTTAAIATATAFITAALFLLACP